MSDGPPDDTSPLGEPFAAHAATLRAMENITAFVNKLEIDLMAARKTGDVVAYLVPFGPDYTQGLALADELVTRLRDRGLTISVDTARAENGLCYLLEDRTPIAA